MNKMLTETQIEDLLINVLHSPRIMQWKGTKIQFCCTIHGEEHPSAGIDIDYSPEGHPNEHYQVFHCFSCGEKGSIAKLVYLSLRDDFKSISQAAKFLENRYGVKTGFSYDLRYGSIPRYDESLEQEESHFTIAKSFLAPFMSGKETYHYFFERGFDKNDMKEYLIGRDLDNETVTIPIFWENKDLAGIIGRYIDPDRPKNMRFKIYQFPKGELIFPLDKVRAIKNTIIGVEAMFDAMMLRKWGFPNVVAVMGAGMSPQQAKQISERCDTFIDLFDNDKGGETARKIARNRLKQYGVTYLTPTYYPETGKDPCEWGEMETVKVIDSAKYLNFSNIPRL